MEETNNNNFDSTLDFNDKPQRPEVLTVFLILTFIFSGLMTLFSIMGYFMIENLFPLLVEQIPQLQDIGLGAMKMVMVFIALIWLMSLVGAILMFFMKRAGFYVYIIPNGLMFIFQLMELMGSFNGLTLMFLAISGLFIFVYAKHLSLMR